MKVNCWEAKQCGRQPGGERSHEMGICPAAVAVGADGINGGTNGGRACWTIQQTLCGDKIQGAFSQKLHECLQCDFYSSVRHEEKENYLSTKQIFAQLNCTV